ncbi:secreted protein [Beggiatoa sp. PS]|nr:secreted protein [Beggiatoa sp. PS]
MPITFRCTHQLSTHIARRTTMLPTRLKSYINPWSFFMTGLICMMTYTPTLLANTITVDSVADTIDANTDCASVQISNVTSPNTDITLREAILCSQ